MASTAPSRARTTAPRGGSGRAPARKPAARSTAKRPAARRPASRSRRRSAQRPSAAAQLLHGLGATLAALWNLLARTVGGLTRGLTGGAKDLDPAHRRDGLGLLLVAGALV